MFIGQLDRGLLKSVEAPLNRLHFFVQSLASVHYSCLEREVFAVSTCLLVLHKLEQLVQQFVRVADLILQPLDVLAPVKNGLLLDRELDILNVDRGGDGSQQIF